MNDDWVLDPRFARARGLLESDPGQAMLTFQRMRDDYGWEDSDLGAYDHEAFMRYWMRESPLSAGVAGVPASFAYPAIKATAQHPWTQPLLMMATPGLMAAARATGIDRASPATIDQLGAGLSGYVGGLLDLGREDR